ncbi:alpha/beta fold hydrolase [Thermoleptolyngbya sp. C42_A2020_037]|uniref:alpha/beta fold hydrolase n=1 Tax=Thermoleptolyngbya sp. C42_A2020_037 TaxID=2747799 RepID=UPI001A0C6DCC|nr:alpha/beta fold hydrolase [Thermoleptolyngbya sp. C42_A2020_037]MBF2086924.1 alpha/beta fold hydrolase [Thermoleptolyngbya sp. C42_A2020_037]
MNAAANGDAQTFVLRDYTLQCGATLLEAKVVYQTYGTLAGDRRNVILYPTSYGAQHPDIEWLIGRDRILDPERWFIVIPNMFGNGLSSSPSNELHCKLSESGFWFTHWDNVRAQEQLLREVFGVETLALVYGWSMGAQQAYHWGALYPERVQRIVALCGTARTTEHNQIFLHSLRAALTADPAWTGDRFEGVPDRGFRAFARIYASWAASQAFYREGLYYPLGYTSLEDYLLRGWEAGYRKRDPHNLLSMIDTWLRCDVGDNPVYQGDYERALGAIRAKTWVMPATTDLYFTPEDCEAEARLIPNSEFRPIPSIWGHRAGNPYQNPADEAFIRQAVADALADALTDG